MKSMTSVLRVCSIDVVLTTSIRLGYHQDMLRKIYKGGKYSYVISIPKNLLKLLGWREGQYVEINRNRKKLEIKDKK